MKIALVAHDRVKPDLLAWFKENLHKLQPHELVCTGTTGRILSDSVPDTQINIDAVKSGPFGGDQQIGAMIANQEIDALIFLEDVLTPQPHDVDVKALLRLAVLYEVPVACNRATADLIISSELFLKTDFRKKYGTLEDKFKTYIERSVS